MPNERAFVRGAALLAGAAAVSKGLGSVYTIVLQNVIGDRGMGLFQMAYPVYATLLTIATAGFPVAISKVVSERVAVGDEAGARECFRISFALLALAGVATFLVLFAGAGVFAGFAGDSGASLAIRAVAPALLVVPVVSVFRGYFQGYQWMWPTASSQIVEQGVRVITILGLSVWLVRAEFGIQVAAAGAAFGAVTGGLAALVMLVRQWFRQPPQSPVSNREHRLSRRALTRKLLHYALPVSLGALAIPLMNNVDVVTVVNLLKASGMHQDAATASFGILTGRGFKLMMLPATLAASIGIAAMPAVSEAVALRSSRLVGNRIDLAIRLTTLLALPAAAGLVLLAHPADVALFKDAAGVTLIQMLAVATVFASIQTTSAAVLQGAGAVYPPVWNLMIACGVKLMGNVALIPVFGVAGAALSTVVSYGVAMVLNFRAMRRVFAQPFPWSGWIIKPVFATFVMSAFLFAMIRQWEWWGGLQSGRWLIMGATLIMIVIGAGVYGIALLATGSLTTRELMAVPKIGPRMATWSTRIGWIKE